VGYDVDRALVEELSRGITRLNERDLGDLLRKAISAGTYRPSYKEEDLRGIDAVIIAVPTPKLSDGNPDLSFLEDTIRTAARYVGKNGLIVVESTLPPGSSGIIMDWLRQEGRSDLMIAYCPERAMPGRLMEEITGNTRIIGADSREAARAAEDLYRLFIRGGIVHTSFKTAEVVKLVENAYRDVNIAFSNEVARICELLGVDFWEVMELANRHPRVNLLRAGLGVGGSCLTKDPLFLYHAGRKLGYEPLMIFEARNVNDSGPYRYARMVHEVMNLVGCNGRIAVLGVTYKEGVSDTRESPSEKFIKFFLEKGYEVVVYDPRSDEAFGGVRAGSIEEAISGSDCVALLVGHPEFRDLEISRIKSLSGRENLILFDATGILRHQDKRGIIYLGVGLPIPMEYLAIKKMEKIYSHKSGS
jgi:UDP-N-acetyl-D-mannosaminuronic acid dehydrogenase